MCSFPRSWNWRITSARTSLEAAEQIAASDSITGDSARTVSTALMNERLDDLLPRGLVLFEEDQKLGYVLTASLTELAGLDRRTVNV